MARGFIWLIGMSGKLKLVSHRLCLARFICLTFDVFFRRCLIVREALPHIPPLTHPDKVESLLVITSPTDSTQPRILVMVVAILTVALIMREDRIVYTTVSSISVNTHHSV